jgi:hypothetical protein
MFFYRFDVFNSRLKYSTKKLECGFGVHFQDQAAVVNEMIKMAEVMRSGEKKTKNLPFQKGILISSKSLLSLFDDLRENRGIEFLLTSHLNQDCLENFFSRVRALGGTNTHPTTVQFIHRLKHLIVGKSSDLVVKTAPVQMEDDSHYTESNGILSQILTKSVEQPTEPEV